MENAKSNHQGDIEILDDTDRVWDKFWEHIDKAEDLVFVATYDMDHKLIAAMTLQKLTSAARRGVKVVLVIDDLNYYPSSTDVAALKEQGGIVIKNNPFHRAYEHVQNGCYQKFFNRNHQKVMLVDNHVFCGSLNVADPYSGARYGDGSFRDLNIILRNQDAKGVRDFFLDLLIQNKKYYPELLKEDELYLMFADLDLKYKQKEMDKRNNEKYVDPIEKFEFLNEMPPEKTEVTTRLLEIIQKAEKSIRIIQPYVQNVEELEEELFEAMEKRNVEVEIITARKRDQPIYKTFLNSDLFSELMKRGAKVYEEPYKYLHMKAVDIDNGRYLTIGSLNQDHCSFYQNNEANVLLSDERNRQNGNIEDLEYYKEFKLIYNNLKRESRVVDPYEAYSYGSYFENRFWRLSLFIIRWFCANREVGKPRCKQ